MTLIVNNLSQVSPELQPLLAAMHQALTFPFNGDLAKAPMERLIAVSLSCRVRLLCEGIRTPVGYGQVLMIWFQECFGANAEWQQAL